MTRKPRISQFRNMMKHAGSVRSILRFPKVQAAPKLLGGWVFTIRSCLGVGFSGVLGFSPDFPDVSARLRSIPSLMALTSLAASLGPNSRPRHSEKVKSSMGWCSQLLFFGTSFGKEYPISLRFLGRLQRVFCCHGGEPERPKPRGVEHGPLQTLYGLCTEGRVGLML